MAFVKQIGSMPIIQARGKLGRPNGVGRFMFGWSKLGEFFEGAGYYRIDGRWGTQRVSKMRHYRPHNPQTSEQQSWRGTFADGVTAWKALSAGEKLAWNKRKNPPRMSGFCRFMREYLNNEAS